MAKRKTGRRRAFGSVTERKKRGETRYYVRFGWGGKRAHRAVGSSRAEAQKVLVQAEALWRAGESWERAMHALFGDVEGAGLTFIQATDRYLAVADKSLKASTYRQRAVRLATVKRETWASLDIAEIRTMHLQRWIERLASDGTAPATQNRYLSAVSAVFKWAGGHEYCRENPARGVSRASEAGNRREVYLTLAEAEAVVRAADPDFKPYVLAALETGCRAGELRELRWRDVDLDVGQIAVRAAYSKTHEPRTVPLTRRMRRSLGALKRSTPRLDGSDRVFTVRGRPITEQIHKTRWGETRARAKPLRSEIAKDLHFHDLRHSAASFLLGAGVPLDVIGQILGHSTTQTTRRYAHLAPNVARAAMDVRDRARATARRKARKKAQKRVS